MDAMRIFHLVVVTLVPFSSVLAQAGAESPKTEALVLKAQTVELESLKAEIKAQGDGIEVMIEKQCHLSVQDAIIQLKKAKVGFLTIILYFTSRIE